MADPILRKPSDLEAMADHLKRVQQNLAHAHDDLRSAIAIYKRLSSEAAAIADAIGL